MPTPPANFDDFLPYNKPLPEKSSRMGPPPKVDTSAASMTSLAPRLKGQKLTATADRNYYKAGQLTPVSNSSGSRSVSPKTPVGRPGAGRSDDYFAPKIANEYGSTPPQQRRAPYGGFSDADGYEDPLYPASSPKKALNLLDRMNSLAPGPFDVNRRAGGKNAFPRRGAEINASDDDRSDTYRSGSRNDSRNESRPGTSASMRSNGSGPVPPRVPKKDNYEGFGSRRRQDDFEPETLSRAGTFPRQAAAVEAPLRTPSAPGPRPNRFQRPSNEMPDRMPRNGERSRSRRPSTVRDTSRPPPPRVSLVRPRTAGRDGSTTPSINLAAEFGIGNPYHTPSQSMSSNASTYSRPGQSSSRSSPARSMSSRGTTRRPTDESSSFDSLMADLQSMSDQPGRGRQTNNPPPPVQSLRHKRSAPTMDAADRSRSRSQSRPRSPIFPPIWEGGRGDNAPMPQINGREYSPPPRTPRTPAGFDASPDRRTRSRSRGREHGIHPTRICKACNDPISGKAISSADGRLTGRYHKACFVCTTCSEPFASSTFYVFGDKPYCERHYHEMNGSLCGSCGDGIEGQYLADENDKKFHPDCFICSDCGRALKDGYFEVNGRAYCERDAWRLTQQSSSSSSSSGMSSYGGIGRKSSAPGTPSVRGGGLPSKPGMGFGLPSRPSLQSVGGSMSGSFNGFGNGFGNARLGLPGSKPKLEKRMTRLGML